jgi:hypothetical protein
MHSVLAKTFGGMLPGYYPRQFAFGLIFPVLIFFSFMHGTHPMPKSAMLYVAINTLLYPYSRFVYEGIVRFIVGENLFLLPAVLMLFVKFMTMAMCWCLAIFVAPVGLAYLFFRNSTN